MRYIIIFSLLALFSCKQKDNTKEENLDITLIENIETDSTYIDNLLELEVPNYISKTEEKEFSIPFNYTINISQEFFPNKWNLCDLKIDTDSSNYKYQYFLGDNIPYKSYLSNDGILEIITTNDSTAITTDKFKKINSDSYRKIYFSDKESVIFKTKKGAIAVLFFKYLKEEKAYSIFYNENDNIGIEANENELLDISINQLRIAKNLYKKSKPTDLLDWDSFKNSLTILNKKVYKDIVNEILDASNSLGKDDIYTQKLYGNHNLISILKLDKEGINLWNALSKIPKNNPIEFETIYNTDLKDRISYFRSNHNFLKIEYQDENSFILKNQNSVYAVFVKTKINKKEVMLFTGSGMNYGEINSKEMAYFYMNLFKNYNDI
ncbi:hypothetical protein QSV08_07775 [Maribacter sp. BPC-D8]|uniref:hypothetical protein n=1 Tax=Maribacter sp. BPC-D8 TaxID=3053613 RepID=UPI002B4A5247|nr:hypothetical protein [Maribacter sp. BPC-D8]WRI31143.1 hypothetical protein QSV08_07775 [Maribacter sp. BPC-D8]